MAWRPRRRCAAAAESRSPRLFEALSWAKAPCSLQECCSRFLLTTKGLKVLSLIIDPSLPKFHSNVKRPRSLCTPSSRVKCAFNCTRDSRHELMKSASRDSHSRISSSWRMRGSDVSRYPVIKSRTCHERKTASAISRMDRNRRCAKP